MSAIYLHIPFCKRLCGYCDFFKSVKLQRMEATLEAMKREIVERKEYLGGSPVETIYFGGGTPSLLSPEQIGSLLELIADNYDLTKLSEVTLEANPDDLTPSYLEAIRLQGVNRLSVGIQSFDDAELRFMNRRHTAWQAVEAVRAAQKVGFDNITIDLIFGVDGFDTSVLQRSVEQALALGVQHISAYHLTIEPSTPFARRLERGELRVVDDADSQREYQLLERELTGAGFEHYEVSNYALEGFRSRHNSSYWHGVHYLGIGAGAHSFNGVERRWAVESVDQYIAGGNERYQVELLTDIDRYNELVMTSLRCSEGVDLELLNRGFDSSFVSFFERNVTPWEVSGKLRREQGHIYITTEHFLISDLIIESLFWNEA